MDLGDLLQLGTHLIQNNRDDATTHLDGSTITNALGEIFGNDGQFDLGSIVSTLAGSGNSNGLMDIVGSWVGSGNNAPIDAEQISELLGSDKVAAFAQSLGLGTDSAKQALADALPAMVDRATPGEGGLDDLLASFGGSGLMGMVGKLFG